MRTIDSGNNWTVIDLPMDLAPDDIWVLNYDTIWAAQPENLTGGVFRTTNGGATWTRQFAAGSQNPDRIYMFNRNIGFISKFNLSKTTNSGVNWFAVPGGGFTDIYFIDSLTGWKAKGDFKKTTDGGLNWQTQILPSGGKIVAPTMKKFALINKDTIWGVESYIITPNGERAILFKTTNGGLNWGYQIPDTSMHIPQLLHVNNFKANYLWAYFLTNGIRSTTGGDTTYYPTSINQLAGATPSSYKLYQKLSESIQPFNKNQV